MSYIVGRFMNLSDNCTVLDVIFAKNGTKFTSIVMVKAVETKLAKYNTENLSVTVGDKVVHEFVNFSAALRHIIFLNQHLLGL